MHSKLPFPATVTLAEAIENKPGKLVSQRDTGVVGENFDSAFAALSAPPEGQNPTESSPPAEASAQGTRPKFDIKTWAQQQFSGLEEISLSGNGGDGGGESAASVESPTETMLKPQSGLKGPVPDALGAGTTGIAASEASISDGVATLPSPKSPTDEFALQDAALTAGVARQKGYGELAGRLGGEVPENVRPVPNAPAGAGAVAQTDPTMDARSEPLLKGFSEKAETGPDPDSQNPVSKAPPPLAADWRYPLATRLGDKAEKLVSDIGASSQPTFEKTTAVKDMPIRDPKLMAELQPVRLDRGQPTRSAERQPEGSIVSAVRFADRPAAPGSLAEMQSILRTAGPISEVPKAESQIGRQISPVPAPDSARTAKFSVSSLQEQAPRTPQTPPAPPAREQTSSGLQPVAEPGFVQKLSSAQPPPVKGETPSAPGFERSGAPDKTTVLPAAPQDLRRPAEALQPNPALGEATPLSGPDTAPAEMPQSAGRYETTDVPAPRLRTAPAIPPMQPPPPPTVPLSERPISLSLESEQFGLSGFEPIGARFEPAPPQPAPLLQTRPELGRQLAAQLIQVAAKMPDRPVELTLSPEELGRVRLSFVAADSGITVTVVAERGETLDLFRRHAEILEQEFREIGYSDVSFEFGQGAQQGDEHDAAPQPILPGTAGLPEQAEHSPPPARLSLDSAAGLDLRL